MKNIRIILSSFLLFLISLFVFTINAYATEYYIAPDTCSEYTQPCTINGNDNNLGTRNEPWATFNQAWSVMGNYDTLIMQNGIYNQYLNPPSQVTISADEDGKAIVDGNYQFTPLGLNASYTTIQGIIFRNGPAIRGTHVISVTGDYNILRRVSAYNSWTDSNSFVINLTATAEYNLVEDCIASGTGRKMIQIFKGTNNTIRRCFAYWTQFDMRQDGGFYPNGGDITIYNASNNILENNIAYGYAPKNKILVQANDPNAFADNNLILGNMAVFGGMHDDGSLKMWGPDPDNPPYTTVNAATRPAGTDPNNTRLRDLYTQPSYRGGFSMYSAGSFTNNQWIDNLAWSNASLGIYWFSTGQDIGGNSFINGTITNNGLDLPSLFGGIGNDARSRDLVYFDSLAGTIIEDVDNNSSLQGTGAHLSNRYIDGELMDGTNGQAVQPLWPWPMEDRLKQELATEVFPEHQKINFSVTCKMGTIINDLYAQNKVAEGIGLDNPDPNWAQDPNNPVVLACNNQPIPTSTPAPTSPTPSPLPGDINNDSVVNILDYTLLSNAFGTSDPVSDINSDGTVNILDYTILSNNFGSTSP